MKKSLEKVSNDRLPAVEKKPKMLQLKVNDKGQLQNAVPEEIDQQILECTGCSDNSAGLHLIIQAIYGVPGLKGSDNNEIANIANTKVIPLMHSISPNDALEGMLAVQMTATHHLSMEFLKRAAHATTTEAINATVNLATKLNRTFVAQVEALAKLRGKGQQKITVEHVHVEAGGQAIVGNVAGVGGGEK